MCNVVREYVTWEVLEKFVKTSMVRYKPYILYFCICVQKPASVMKTFLNILLTFHIQ
jgi:hypothetical protein